MKKEQLKIFEVPFATILCGLLLHLMDWLTVFRISQKSGNWAMEVEVRLLTNRLSASLVMIAAMGIFLIRKRLSTKECYTGCGMLVLWGLVAFGLGMPVSGGGFLLDVLRLPVYLFSFITEFLVLFGSTATGFMLQAPAILAPAMLTLFLIGRKNSQEEDGSNIHGGRTLLDR